MARATAYVAHALAESFSVSARVDASSTGRTKGVDARLNPMMGPGNDTATHGGEKANAMIGFNWYGQSGFLKDHRLAAEYSWNIYMDANGPQLKPDGMFVLGWQKAF